MTTRPLLLLAMIGGALAIGAGPRGPGGIVTKMTPDMIEQALVAALSAPEPSADKEDLAAMRAAMDGGALGFYPLGLSWFTTPYSRVVQVGVQALWAREKPVVAKSLLVPELHVYIAPVHRFSRSTELMVAFIRPAGATDPLQNKYPVRIEPAEAGIAEFIAAGGGAWGSRPWPEDSHGLRLVFPLDALTQGSVLVTVYNGIIMNCDGPVCLEGPFDLSVVR